MFSIELELISVVADPKGGNQALSIRIRGRYIFNVSLTSKETSFSANAMFSIELELISVVSNPKGGNQELSVRSKATPVSIKCYVFN